MDSPINLKLAQRKREDAAGLNDEGSAQATSAAASAPNNAKFFKGAPMTEAEKAAKAKKLSEMLRARGD